MKYYLMLMTAVLSFSFVGALSKVAQGMVGVYTIVFCRFFFGVLFLFLIVKLQRKKITFHFNEKWIWIGMLGKSINYLTENHALLWGFSYGNIIVWPCQFIVFCMFSVFLLKEKITPVKWFAIFLCLSGVFMIAWNGVSAETFFEGGNFYIFMLYVVSSIAGSFFVLSQKMLVGKMREEDMNISAFSLSAIFTSVPMFATFELVGDINIWPILAFIALGCITGGAFLLNGKALAHIPFYIAGILQNTVVVFSLIWGALFFNEEITTFVIVGTLTFALGLVVVNLPNIRKGKTANSDGTKMQAIKDTGKT